MEPRPNAASVALVEGATVLLIQRAFAPWQGAWTLPGGRAEAGEAAEVCARREVLEELGLELGALVPVVLLALAGTGFRLQVFATESWSGALAPSPEVTALAWLGRDDLAGRPTTPDLADVLDRTFWLLRAGHDKGPAPPEE